MNALRTLTRFYRFRERFVHLGNLDKLLASIYGGSRYLIKACSINEKKNVAKIQFKFNDIELPSSELVLATLFTGTKDPQRNYQWERDNFEVLKNWYESIQKLDMSAIIFYDHLSINFINKYQTKKIIFLKVVFFDTMTLLDERFIMYRDFIRTFQSKLKKVILSDISDVIFYKNPFKEKYLKDTSIYFGIDNAKNYLLSKGMNNKLVSFICSSNIKIPSRYLMFPVFNDGFIGGESHIVLSYLNRMSFYLLLCNDKENHNMVCFNLSVYEEIEERNYLKLLLNGILLTSNRTILFNNSSIKTGYPILNVFKSYEKDLKIFATHK